MILHIKAKTSTMGQKIGLLLMTFHDLGLIPWLSTPEKSENFQYFSWLRRICMHPVQILNQYNTIPHTMKDRIITTNENSIIRESSILIWTQIRLGSGCYHAWTSVLSLTSHDTCWIQFQINSCIGQSAYGYAAQQMWWSTSFNDKPNLSTVYLFKCHG